jgi:hypothetical protein
MGSELVLKSVPGQGSLFYFDLDLSDDRERVGAELQTLSSDQQRDNRYIPLPEKYLLPIYELTICGDIYEIMRYLEGLGKPEAQYVPFVQHLQQLSASFNIHRLRRFLEAYLPKDAAETRGEQK